MIRHEKKKTAQATRRQPGNPSSQAAKQGKVANLPSQTRNKKHTATDGQTVKSNQASLAAQEEQIISNASTAELFDHFITLGTSYRQLLQT